MADIPTTAELLLAWDAKRPRSLQKELGMSQVGGCRKAAGFHLAGEPPTSKKASVQAVLGTAVHEAADRILRDMRNQGEIPGESYIGEELEFAGIKGHPDLIAPPIVRDVKTLGYGSQLESYKLNGPPKRHQWQVSLYAAAAILRGLDITTIQLDYIDRGSGQTWMWEAAFSMDLVREAIIWLDIVRQTPLEYLARDYAPDSEYCKGCPFRLPCWGEAVTDRDPRSVLYVEDPDAMRWMAQLETSRAVIKAAREREAQAKGALDALRPNDKGRADVEVPGSHLLLRFTVTEPERLDADQVREDYGRAGGSAPFKKAPSVKLTLVPKPDAK